jgi:hypothetical protein
LIFTNDAPVRKKEEVKGGEGRGGEERRGEERETVGEGWIRKLQK